MSNRQSAALGETRPLSEGKENSHWPTSGVQEKLIEPVHSHHNLPHKVVEIMVEKLSLFEGVDLLVSSSGLVDIADGIRRDCPGAVITCVERDESLRRILESKGCYLMDAGDFLKVDCWPGFDRIALIPPFMYGQEIKHVRHAFLKLKPGGRLVAIVSDLAHFDNRLCQTSPALRRMNSGAKSFRDWLNEIGSEIEELPKESVFEGNGTAAARLRIVVINSVCHRRKS